MISGSSGVRLGALVLGTPITLPTNTQFHVIDATWGCELMDRMQTKFGVQTEQFFSLAHARVASAIIQEMSANQVILMGLNNGETAIYV